MRIMLMIMVLAMMHVACCLMITMTMKLIMSCLSR